MSLVNLNNRLRKLERQLRPHGDGCFTLEELCRAIWDRNKQSFIELAEGNSYRLFVSWFEAFGDGAGPSRHAAYPPFPAVFRHRSRGSSPSRHRRVINNEARRNEPQEAARR